MQVSEQLHGNKHARKHALMCLLGHKIGNGMSIVDHPRLPDCQECLVLTPSPSMRENSYEVLSWTWSSAMDASVFSICKCGSVTV
jgi:hypothetical protein